MIKSLFYIALPLTALVLYRMAINGKQLADKLTFKIVGGNLPKFRQGVASIPLTIALTNPVNLSLRISDLKAELFVDQNGKWVQAGHTDQADDFVIPALSKELVNVVAMANLRELLPFKGLSVQQAIAQLQQRAFYRFRVEGSAKIEGIPITFSEIIHV